MTYIIEFKSGKWLRVTEEQGLAIIKGVQEDNKQWISINGELFPSNQITSITKDR